MRRGGGANSRSQLQPRQRIGGALLMKGCNQVAHANLPHPVGLTCQNASLMTEGLVCLRKKTMRGKSSPCNAQERMTYLTTNLFYILVYNISVLRAVNKLSQMSC